MLKLGEAKMEDPDPPEFVPHFDSNISRISAFQINPFRGKMEGQNHQI
jgi:hypothetical protein